MVTLGFVGVTAIAVTVVVTVKVSALVVVCGVAAESVTLTVNEAAPVAVGVPVIVPVLAFNVNPAGNAPVTNPQVYGVTPPEACSVVE